MKIVVLAGSPKGETSVTVQYVRYLEKYLSKIEFKFFHISFRIKKIERDEKAFQDIIDEVQNADAVLWAFPLYVLLVPAQYKRFIELIWERGVQDAFKDKYAAVLSTSIHFFDHTAHQYMRAICDDLEMNFSGAYSADMHDLKIPEQQKKLRLFGESFIRTVELGSTMPRHFFPIKETKLDYIPGDPPTKTDTQGRKVVIVHDAKKGQTNLLNMIKRMKSSFQHEVDVFNLHDVDIKGGCMGCLKCGQNYECAYTGKDEYIDFYNKKIKTAHILVFAGAISDRFLSSRWRLFFDRGFFNCHTPSLVNKQFAFLISGPLSQTWNIREVFDGYSQWQQSNLVDIVSDEVTSSSQLDEQISSLAERCVWNALHGYKKPITFLGVGGHKIFRDDVFSNLRFVFQADHRYFKSQDLYDFPRKKDWGASFHNVF
ncbi:NAD(P)H-dependent oxidoreductase [candidate division CSSED10-310 bacterium]|uniref:NAD(P)H-dependent oxidoreductase n=1 Tax=candidate division CSSED10-310 bacterium TaxID=2855610 RepID=A0ABV6Z6S3_UNCC1